MLFSFKNNFCNFSEADENNTDDLRFVRNEVPKKLTFETLSETLNQQTTILLFHKKGKDKVLTWTADKPDVSGKRNEFNIISNKPGPSRRVKDIKTPLDTWSLLMTDDILLEIVTNTNKNIKAFVNEHVGFDKNDNIYKANRGALIGLFYLRRALNQNFHVQYLLQL